MAVEAKRMHAMLAMRVCLLPLTLDGDIILAKSSNASFCAGANDHCVWRACDYQVIIISLEYMSMILSLIIFSSLVCIPH